MIALSISLYKKSRNVSLALPFAGLLWVGLIFSFSAVSCKTTPVDTLTMDPPVIKEPQRQSNDPVVVRRDNSIYIGDELELFVEEDKDFNGVYKVREQGDIILPRIGRVPVKGFSVSKAQLTIKQLLEANQLRDATVIVDRVRKVDPKPPVNQKVGGEEPVPVPRMLAYFTGHVKRPGQHWITLPRGKPVGIYKAILISGGIARFANESKVEVLRTSDSGETRRMILNVKAVREGKAPDPPLYEGDIIFVPEKRIGT